MAGSQAQLVQFESGPGEQLHNGVLIVDQQYVGTQYHLPEMQILVAEYPPSVDRSVESNYNHERIFLLSVLALTALSYAVGYVRQRRLGMAEFRTFEAKNASETAERTMLQRFGDLEYGITPVGREYLDDELDIAEDSANLWGDRPNRSLPEAETYLNNLNEIFEYNQRANVDGIDKRPQSRIVALSAKHWGGVQMRYDKVKRLSNIVADAKVGVESAEQASDVATRASLNFIRDIGNSVDNEGLRFSFCRGSEVIDTRYKATILSAVAALPDVLTKQTLANLPFEPGAYQDRAYEFSEVLKGISKIELSELTNARLHVNAKLASLKLVMDFMTKYPKDLAATSFAKNYKDTMDKLEVIDEILNKDLIAESAEQGVYPADNAQQKKNAELLINQAIITMTMRPKDENSLCVKSWLQSQILADYVGSIQIPKVIDGVIGLEYVIKNRGDMGFFNDFLSMPPHMSELLEGKIKYGNTVPTQDEIAYLTEVATRVRNRQQQFLRNFIGSDMDPSKVLRFNFQMQRCHQACTSIETAVLYAINKPDGVISDTVIAALRMKPDTEKTKNIGMLVYAKKALIITDEAQGETLSDTVNLSGR